MVELILIDKGFAFDANHPFHLHGHSFRVVGMEKIGENVTEEEIIKLDEEGLIKRNLVNPPLKDTITVPDGGYTILRFHASNPGNKMTKNIPQQIFLITLFVFRLLAISLPYRIPYRNRYGLSI